MNKPDFHLDLDDNLNAFLTWDCPQCKRHHRHALSSLRPGVERLCECRYVVVISGDDFQKAQEALDDLRTSMRGLGTK